MNLVPTHTPLPDIPTLQRCWTRNPHGAGFMFPAAGELIVRKGFMTFDHFLIGLQQLGFVPGQAQPFPLTMHFRIGTKGANSAENTHPWTVIDKRVALTHNGIISGLNPHKLKRHGADPNLSDSQHFASLIRPLVSSALSKTNPGASLLNNLHADPPQPPTLTKWALSFKEIAEAFISPPDGYPNKVILMDGAGGTLILNEHKGIVDGGIWWSNDGFVEPKMTFSQSFIDACDPRAFVPSGATTGTGTHIRRSERRRPHTEAGRMLEARIRSEAGDPLSTKDSDTHWTFGGYSTPKVGKNGVPLRLPGPLEPRRPMLQAHDEPFVTKQDAVKPFLPLDPIHPKGE